MLEPAVEFLFATVACRRFDALLVLVLVDGGVVPPPPRFLIDVNHAVALLDSGIKDYTLSFASFVHMKSKDNDVIMLHSFVFKWQRDVCIYICMNGFDFVQPSYSDTCCK